MPDPAKLEAPPSLPLLLPAAPREPPDPTVTVYEPDSDAGRDELAGIAAATTAGRDGRLIGARASAPAATSAPALHLDDDVTEAGVGRLRPGRRGGVDIRLMGLADELVPGPRV